MSVSRLLAVAFLAITVSGCAGGPGSCPRGGVRSAAKCEEIVAEGLAGGEREAKRIAKEGVTQQLADARGNLLALGFKRVRGTAFDTRCRPHTLGLGLVKCTAVARLCGR